MSIFNEFFKKEKPVFTGLKFGFGSGGGGASAPGIKASGGTTVAPGNGYQYHIFTNPNSDDFQVFESINVDVLVVAGGGGGGDGS